MAYLSSFPPNVQAALASLTQDQFRLLGIEVAGHRHREMMEHGAAKDFESVVHEAHDHLSGPVSVTFDYPDRTALHLAHTLRAALSLGEELDPYYAESLATLADVLCNILNSRGQHTDRAYRALLPKVVLAHRAR